MALTERMDFWKQWYGFTVLKSFQRTAFQFDTAASKLLCLTDQANKGVQSKKFAGKNKKN